MTEVLSQMHMQVRRESFLRGHLKLTSFRLPQETTRQLLRHQPQVDNVNDEEEPDLDREEEDDDETCSTCSCTSSSASATSSASVVTATLLSSTTTSNTTSTNQQQQQQPLNRRKRALARTPTQRMTSFRLPKDTTHRLLMEHPLEAFKEDEDEDAEHAEAGLAAAGATTAATSTAFSGTEEEKQQANSLFLLSKRKSLIRHDRRAMTSFRLPKETTPHLLHFDVEQDDPSPERSAPVKRRVLSVASSPVLFTSTTTATTSHNKKEEGKEEQEEE